eukprot:3339767-Lingulodinium_polyedra.AAC.1
MWSQRCSAWACCGVVRSSAPSRKEPARCPAQGPMASSSATAAPAKQPARLPAWPAPGARQRPPAAGGPARRA